MVDQFPDGGTGRLVTSNTPSSHVLPVGTGLPSTALCLLEDSLLPQVVPTSIPHGYIVHSLNGPVSGLEDILFQALGGGDGQLDLEPGEHTEPRSSLGAG